MKKILVIAPYSYLPFFSGGQKFIAGFLDHLGKESDLTVISVKENDLSLARNYQTIPLLKKSFSRYYDLSLVKKITAIVKEKNIGTVIWEHPYFSWLAFRIRKRTGVKTIIHTHNIEFQRFRSTGRWWWPVLRTYEKNCFKKADSIFFISQEDMDFATDTWHIPKEKCGYLPFGVDISHHPHDRDAARNTLLQKHSVKQDERVILFNGLLNYKPNLDALKVILDEINPRLLSTGTFKYKIIICGKGLPASLNELKEYTDKNVIYTGFVDDIETYFKGADILLSPVLSGGGVKTKIVEAIAFGTTVIATKNSAAGIDIAACGEKLQTVADGDWEAMAPSILAYDNTGTVTPASFYRIYNWENIITNIMPFLE